MMKKSVYNLLFLVCFLFNFTSALSSSEEQDPWTRTAFASLSPADWQDLQQIVSQGNVIQNFALQQMATPYAPPSQEFFALPEAIQRGAQAAVDFYHEALAGFACSTEPERRSLSSSHSSFAEELVEKETMTLLGEEFENTRVGEGTPLEAREDSLLLPIVQHEEREADDTYLVQKEFAARQDSSQSLERRRSLTPPRIRDSYYMETVEALEEGVASVYKAQEDFKACGYTLDCLEQSGSGKVAAAYALDAVGGAVEIVDTVTFGAVSAVSEGLDAFAQTARTGIRRGVRAVTDNQRLAQNLGDYAYLGLAVAGPGKLKIPGKIVQGIKRLGEAVTRSRKLEALDLAVKKKGQVRGARPNVEVNKPLLGNRASAKITKTRTVTDLGGVHDRATAKSIFRNQTKGKKVLQKTNKKGTVRRFTEDNTQIRMDPEGTTRLDLPNRGTRPNGETIHFNDKSG